MWKVWELGQIKTCYSETAELVGLPRPGFTGVGIEEADGWALQGCALAKSAGKWGQICRNQGGSLSICAPLWYIWESLLMLLKMWSWWMWIEYGLKILVTCPMSSYTWLISFPSLCYLGTSRICKSAFYPGLFADTGWSCMASLLSHGKMPKQHHLCHFRTAPSQLINTDLERENNSPTGKVIEPNPCLWSLMIQWLQSPTNISSGVCFYWEGTRLMACWRVWGSHSTGEMSLMGVPRLSPLVGWLLWWPSPSGAAAG